MDLETGGGTHTSNKPPHAFPIYFRVQERMSPWSPQLRVLLEGSENARDLEAHLPAGHLHPNTGARPGRIHYQGSYLPTGKL
jgi:hypothetical protein